jgi:predicted RNA-binding protein with PIN domain
MQQRARYLIVDGHSIIFAWPELRKMQERRSALAREALIKQLRDYQDWSGVRVVAVFDGSGSHLGVSTEPGEIQIFYSRRGQTADAIVERLAANYAGHFDVTVATADAKEQATVSSFGARCVSAEGLRDLLREVRPRGCQKRGGA